MAAVETVALPELDSWRVDLTEVQSRSRPDADALAEAERRGHEAGLATGRELAEAELFPLRAALSAAATALAGSRDEVAAAAEVRAVELAVALAGKILGTALELDPALLLEVVSGALRRLVDKDDVVLEVNPDDVELLRSELDTLADGIGGSRAIDVVGERRVGRGGCVVRTRDGEIDARIETQLARADELLRRSLAVAR